MPNLLRLAIVSAFVALSGGSVMAQSNTPTPNAEDAQKNAFQTPTAGKDAPDTRGGGKDGHADANPESRLNDNPRPEDRVGAPNMAPK
jgi:hypothetical protein